MYALESPFLTFNFWRDVSSYLCGTVSTKQFTPFRIR